MSKKDFEFTDNSKKIIQGLRAAAGLGMTKAVLAVESNIKPLVPVDKGNLRNSITNTVDINGMEVVGKVGSGLTYAIYVEKGTGEFAENGMGRKGGWVYKAPDGKWYRTRGNRPQPYMKPGFRNSQAQIKKILGDQFSGYFHD